MARRSSLRHQRRPFAKEQECLQILLRDSQPIIICPARSLPRHVPPRIEKPLAAGRLLVLSPFALRENRVTAALADEVLVRPYHSPAARLERTVPLHRCMASFAAAGC